jgi:hypothetical protein
MVIPSPSQRILILLSIEFLLSWPELKKVSTAQKKSLPLSEGLLSNSFCLGNLFFFFSFQLIHQGIKGAVKRFFE